MRTLAQLIFIASALFSLGACSTQTVKSTTITEAIIDSTAIPEEELLDIGVAIFDPGLDQVERNREELTFGDVRVAETYYVSHMLSQTLQNTGNWGVVRVIPDERSNSDLSIEGTILQSDGEAMRLQVKVTDSSGRVWIDQEYEEIVSRFSYDPRMRQDQDAFQGLYNRIANDILAFRQANISRQDILTLRTISEIRFAQSFAPQVYDDYLRENREGLTEIVRLPAENDPILNRISSIRERDHLYVDTMQDYYSTFVRQMQEPYTEFRRMSYDEVIKMDRLQAEARRNMILGVAAIIGGIAATQSDSSLSNVATWGGIAVGGWLIRDAFNDSDEAKLHVEALAELGQSLEREIAPRTIQLEERSITLSGSVESQYDQWREILTDMYAEETGASLSSNL